MRKKVVFILGSILLAFVSISFWSSVSERNLGRGAEADSQMCKKDTRPIPFKRLSDEKSYPFLEVGEPLSLRKGKEPAYNEVREAVARFPDIKSCLVPSEREKQIPNLTSFDWEAIRGTTEAEVCLFRVFSSIGSVEGSAQWLKNQGFDMGYISDVDASNATMRNSGQQRPGKMIDASWSFKECGRRIIGRTLFDSIPDPLYTRLVARGFWIGAWFSADNEVLDIIVAFNVK